MVRIMIREGQDKNQQTQNFGNTPMHIAARNGHYLIVKYLLDIGSSHNITNLQGLTPRQFLSEALVTDPKKIDKLVKKDCKNKSQEKALRDKFKVMADTFRLLSQAEQTA